MPAVRPPTPAYYFQMDDAGGGVRLDSVGGHHLEDVNGNVPQVAGKLGGAPATGPGSPEAWLRRNPAGGLLCNGVAWSADFWLYVSNYAASGLAGIVGAYDATTSNRGWAFYISTAGTLYFSIGQTGGTTYAASAISGSWPKNVWRYMSVKVDPDSSKWWVSYNRGYWQPRSITGPVPSVTTYFGVGKLASLNTPFDGRVDDLAIWPGILLSDDEFNWRFNGGAGQVFSTFQPAWARAANQTVCGGGVLCA